MTPIDEGTAALLDAPNFATVSTKNDDGSIHSVVVWIKRDGDEVVVNTAKGRKWPRNLERDPSATVAVHNEENPYVYSTLVGKATDFRDGDAAWDDIDSLAKKYLDEDKYPFAERGGPEERLTIRITPEKVSHHAAG